MWYNRPAITGDQEKIYLGWMTSDRRVMIGEVDRNSGAMIERVELHRWHYLDDHGAPIVHLIKEGLHKGKLISIFNLHNSEIYFQRSLKPYIIDKWEEKKLVSKCECTYPSLLEMDNTLYLFYRKQVDSESKTRSYFMKTSQNYGDTWSNEKEIIRASDEEWIYAMVSTGENSTIHIAWGIHNPVINDIQGIYYAKSNDKGRSWSGLINKENNEYVESGNKYLVRSPVSDKATRIWDFQIDQFNNPAILFVDYDEKKVLAHWTKFVDDRWAEIELGENSRYYYPCGLVFKGNNTKQVYMSKLQNNNVSTIYKLSIDDDFNSFNLEGHIKNESSFGYCRPLSSENYDGLIYSAVKSYSNYMDFDTWLINTWHIQN